MPDVEEVTLESHDVVEWCTRELTLQDTRTHCLVVTRSREYYACTMGVAEAKFVQSILLDWGVTAEPLRSSISLTTAVQSR